MPVVADSNRHSLLWWSVRLQSSASLTVLMPPSSHVRHEYRTTSISWLASLPATPRNIVLGVSRSTPEIQTTCSPAIDPLATTTALLVELKLRPTRYFAKRGRERRSGI